MRPHTLEELDEYRRQEERVERIRDAAPELLEALEWFLTQIDEGTLVRDISKDHESGFSLKMVKFVAQLQKAQAAIAAAKG